MTALTTQASDLRDGLKKLGGEHGIDVVYDPIGDRYAEPALRSLAWYGRYLVVGFAAGRNPEAAAQSGAAEKLRRARRVLGLMDRARAGRRIAPTPPTWSAGAPRASSARMSMRAYPLADAAQALKDIAARKVMGKVVLKP